MLILLYKLNKKIQKMCWENFKIINWRLELGGGVSIKLSEFYSY